MKEGRNPEARSQKAESDREEEGMNTMIENQEQVKNAFMSKRAAAGYCALSPRSLDYARERGELPFHKVGAKVVFRVKDLDAFMGRFRVAV